MVFSSSIFLFLFLPSVLIIYYVNKPIVRNFILLISSLLFYAWGEPKYVLLMIGSIVLNYIFGRLLDVNHKPKVKKFFFILALSLNILTLVIFKYTSFFIENINHLGLSFFNPDILLPIGISFYTFQAMSYIIDVYRFGEKSQKNILNLALYISFFPQLIAGPIVRYQSIYQQIQNRKESFEQFDSGVKRFIVGLFKKVFIANTLGAGCNLLISNGIKNMPFIDAWLTIILFAFQIYFDFSGYSDMAIGLARFFGFDFFENFNYPYISKSITEFWRRWHISLSTWFRDYVFLPLEFKRRRVKTFRQETHIMIVFLLTGLWHGASWNYVIWGIYYGLLLVAEKLFLKRVLEKMPVFFQHFYSIFFILIGWTIFKFEDIEHLGWMMKNLFLLYDTNIASITAYSVLRNNFVIIIIGFLFSTPVLNQFKRYLLDLKVGNFVVSAIYVAMFILSMSMLVATSFNPFIYFRF